MSKADILRYMRTSSKTDNEQILALADKAIEIIKETAVPKTLCRVFDCEVGEDTVTIDGVTFNSRRLAQNMSGCKKAAVFGATLGIAVDKRIKIASATDVALAMALQAAAADKIEEVCDNLEETIKAQYGVTLRQRYSPGYFDLDITEQKKFFSLLQLEKRIGLTLTDTCEMVPTKSVTAFIGMEG